MVIIATVFVLLVPTSVFAHHEPNPYDVWHQGCQDQYDKRVYVDGGVTQSNIDSFEACKNKMPYPEKPPFVSDCNALRDYEYEKLERAIEVYEYDENRQQKLVDGIESQHEKCLDVSITPEQEKCYVELDTLLKHHYQIEKEFRTGTDGVEHWNQGDKIHIDYYEKAVHQYDSCMGYENKESKKLFDRLGSALYYSACYEAPHRDLKYECFDNFVPLTVQQGLQFKEEIDDCARIWDSGNAALTYEQRSTDSPEKEQVFNDVVNCFNEKILRLEPEPQEPPRDSNIEGFTPSEIECGTGTIEKDGICVLDYNYKSSETSSSGGGCLIATATFDSELSPQVQKLREIRDSKLLNTESGSQFMESFNSFYYSFSPYIADYERENHVFKEIIKIGITPMLSTLSLMDYAESESEVLSVGVGVILLNLGMYLGVPIMAIMRFRKSWQ